MRIAVAGAGYVGLSLAVLLSQNNEVALVDVIPEKIDKVNARISPIQDEYIEKYFQEMKLNLVATLDGESAYKEADFIIIAAPTNYDSKKNFFAPYSSTTWSPTTASSSTDSTRRQNSSPLQTKARDTSQASNSTTRTARQVPHSSQSHYQQSPGSA